MSAFRPLEMDWLTPEVVAKFWSKVDTTAGPEGCWPWQGVLNRTGYGCFVFGPRNNPPSRIASRTAYAIANGESAGDLLVCHSCDNPPCVNPAHLFIGTHSDNQRDSLAKQRNSRALRTHCPAGHPYSGTNLRISTEGHRQCRTCSLASQNETRRARRLAGLQRDLRDQAARRQRDAFLRALAEQQAVS